MRQLAAIMFTDIVGYSTLMSKDELSAMQVLALNRKIQYKALERFNGRFIKELGDGTLSIFQSSWDAVRCAAMIQSGMHSDPTFDLRIGIHIGDIVVADNDVFGDGVNIAARIQSVAEPGGIWISERVFEDIKNKPGMKAAFIGERALKNIDQPVRIYVVDDEWIRKPDEWMDDQGEFIFGQRATGAGQDEKEQATSIAVMPFTDLSPEKDQAYFCDGMAEEMINALAQIEGLRVVARTSAFSFRGRVQDIREIGRILNVDKVVEGSVRKSGTRLRIAVQLINVKDGYHIWSSQFDREMQDIFVIQDEISLIIADRLRVKFSKADREKILKRHTDDPEAYDLYLKGRYHWYRRYEGGFLKGLEFFQQAIEKDPLYALAYIGVADSYASMGLFSYYVPGDTYAKARAAVKKAIEIEPDMAEANASMGWIRMSYDWDWEGAENEFLQVIRSKPDYTPARIWYGMLLSIKGRFAESLVQMKKAVELEPLEPLTNTMVGWTYYMSRHYEQSIAVLGDVIRTDPHFPISYWLQAGNLLAVQRVDEAILCAEQLVRITDEAMFALASLAVAYIMAGRKEEMLRIYERMNELSKKRYDSPVFRAIYYLGTGDRNRVLECLEQAYSERESMMVFLAVIPVFDQVRQDPRFQNLVQKMGL